MARGLQTSGLVILLIAFILYLLGNTLWLGISVLGFLVEIVGWLVVLSESNKSGGK